MSAKGIVFNIQKFSLNDGPGIRTVVFLKGCPLHCGWCANPESQSADVQILWDEKRCLHCGHCAEICPQKAIHMSDDKRIHIDHSLCVGCLTCVNECPGHALTAEGESRTVEEVLNVCLQDLPFYEESGGGVTLSGGEALMHPEFSAALLKALKEKHIHTAIETTGYASEEIFRAVAENLDLFLFDIKHWDPVKHKEGTGVTNELPLHNMKVAVEMGKEVLPRLPVIPGFNNSLEDAEGFCRRLKEVGLSRIQLLPFHQFGEVKYAKLGRDYAFTDVQQLHPEDLTDFQQVFLDHGIEAFF